MATPKNFLVDIDLNKGQLLNFKYQNLAIPPSTTGWAGLHLGFTYWNTTDKKTYSWDGASWISGNYTHPNHSGDVVSNSDGATTIQPKVVSNSKLADVPGLTLKGNSAAGTASPDDLTAAQVRALLNIENGAQANVASNLTIGAITASTQVISNSFGTGVTLVSATTTNAGLQSAADKSKLDGIQAGAQANVATNLTYTASSTNGIVVSSTGTNATIPLTDGTNAGLMTPLEKSRVAAAILTTTTSLAGVSFFSTDATLSGNSDTIVSSQKAVKSYVDNLVLSYGSLVFQDGYDAATNTPNLDVTPIAGIKKGWTYVVTAAGTFFSSTLLEPGDLIIAKKDNPILESDWTSVNKNIPDVLLTVLNGFTLGSNTSVVATDTILSALSKLQAQVNARETSILAGNTAQYWRGDKTFQTLNTSVVPEGTNQYFTEARVRATVITGFAVNNSAIVAGDNIVIAFGKAQGQINTKANENNANLTGIPVAPTAAPATNSTQIATTEFVKSLGYSTTTGQVNKVVTGALGNGALTTFAVSHTFGTDAIGQARFVADNSVFECEIIIGNNVVTFNTNTPPATGTVRFVVIG